MGCAAAISASPRPGKVLDLAKMEAGHGGRPHYGYPKPGLFSAPSTSCIIQKELGLSDECAAFDVGLGCSGYPYGLWLAGMMMGNGGFRRVLLLHGETPTGFRKIRPFSSIAIR